MFERFSKKKEKKAQKRKRAERTTVTCPECGSDELYFEAGMITGMKYHCKKCDYIGTFVVEKNINGMDMQGQEKKCEKEENDEGKEKKEPKYRIDA